MQSLRYKIAVPFTLLVVLAVLLPGLIAVYQGFDTLTARAEDAQLLAAQIAADHLTYALNEKMTTVEGIAQLGSLKQMVPERIDEDILNIRLHEKGFTSLIIIDADGTIISFVDKTWNVGKSLATREYFQVALNEGHSNFSDSVLTLDETITVVAATPIINDDGDIVGVLAGTFDVHLENFNQVILDTRIGATGYAYLVDGKGIVITHPDTERTLAQEDFSGYPVVEKAIAGGRGTSTYDFEGTEMLAAYVPIQPSGWGVVVHQPIAEANAPAAQLRNLILIVVIASAAIAVLLGLLISHRITIPLSLLKASAATIGAGNLEEPVPVLGDDEIGTLAKTFDEMRLDLKEYRAQLEQANEELRELDRLKSTFVSTASHELRTPLTAIKAYVELIKDGDLGAVNEQQREKLEIADRNIDRLINLVNVLLDLSRIEARKLDLHKEILDPAKLIDEATQLMEKMVHSWGHELRVAVGEELPSIRGDHDRVLQVFENLVGNAVKYTSAKGVVSIGAEPQDGFVRFWVKDTGIGIPTDEIVRIFDRFYHVDHPLVRKHRGTGLGLAIAKGIVEAHGGEIWVETEVDKGSTFFFTLPALEIRN